MMRIGLLLGSFDPIHIGHLSCIYDTLNKDLVDKVYIIPAFQNPWKEKSSSFEDRCDMCELSLNGYQKDNIDVLRVEGYIKPKYSYELIEFLIKHFSSKFDDVELYIIGGSDMIESIPRWQNGEWILENVKTIKVARDESESEYGISISSTIIRNMIKNGKLPFPYISQNVYDFIVEKNLYN